MSKDGRNYTMVFRNVTDDKASPFTTPTPWGTPSAVSRDDEFRRLYLIEDALERYRYDDEKFRDAIERIIQCGDLDEFEWAERAGGDHD